MSYKTLFSALTALIVSIQPTFAAGPKQIGKFGEWTAYVTTQSGKKVCYMVSFPKTKKGKYSKRGDVYALITHRPREKNFNVVSLHAGYPFKTNASVSATIAKRKYTLFTDEFETAWSSSEFDNAIVASMTKGHEMVVKGQSRRGTQTEDKYSLNGSARALRAINSACGVK